jgi:ribose 5-phosphate isomerase B
MKKHTIALCCDEAAYQLKEILKTYLQEEGYSVEDYGTHDAKAVLYPDIAVKVAEAIKKGKQDRGILMCGTGIGMAISANKISGIRAAQAHDTFSAERARKSNDAQILAMGARVIGPELAKFIAKAFLESEFEGGSSLAKVQRINELDKKKH